MANTYVYFRLGGEIRSFASNKSWEITRWLDTNLKYEYNVLAYSTFKDKWWSHTVSRSGGYITTIEEFPDDIPNGIRAYHLITME